MFGIEYPPILSGIVYDIASTVHTQTTITLTFTNLLSARSYEYSLSSTSASAGFGAWTALAANKIITGLTAGTAYWIKVRIVNGVWRGRPSPVLPVTTSVVYETETDTLIAAMSVPPSTTRSDLINTLIAALKTHSIWTHIDLFYMLAAHDSQAARLNWKSPSTFALTATSAPTFTADRGYAGNGTSSYLDSGWTASVNAVNCTQNSTHVQAWDLTNTIDNGLQAGWYDASAATGSWIGSRFGSGVLIGAVNSSVSTQATASITGLVASTRTLSSAVYIWRDGVFQGGSSSTSSALSPGVFTIGKVATNYSAHQIAYASCGAGDNIINMATFRTDLYAYLGPSGVGAVA